MSKFSKRLHNVTEAQMHRIAGASSIFIMYPRFKAILGEIEEVFVFSKTSPEPLCLLLVGDAGVGKSSILRTFANARPSRQGEDRLIHPILSAAIPSPATVGDVASALLTGLGAPNPARGSIPYRSSRVFTLVRECQVELIILDEFQHLIASPTKYALAAVSNWIKGLINASGQPLVLSGMPESRGVLESNPQLASRFRHPIHMDPMSLKRDEDEYRKFLMSYNEALNRYLPSSLLSSELPERLMLASGGYLRDLTRLIRDASRTCILENREVLDQAVLCEHFDLLGNRGDYDFNPFQISYQEIKRRLGRMS